MIITASGGSFRDKKREELIGVTKEAALKHPNWSMGAKITIDSATMMNKGFEVIEAHHLFHIPYEKIDTILHKESIVHSLVEFNDGTIKAELGSPDMHTPIAYALRYPHHLQNESDNLDLIGLNLHFEELSDKRYPCLGYAYLAAKKGGIYPAILNAANEAAVKLFLLDKIEFLEIEKIIYDEITNKKYETIPYTLENVVSISLLVIKEILKNPSDYIESKEFFSWEQFFTKLLIQKTKSTFLKYSKRKLNKNYLEGSINTKIINSKAFIAIKSLFDKAEN